MSRDIEEKATELARKVDTSLLPFKSAVADWRTWVNDKGQWMFVEKAVVAAVATAYDYEQEKAFKWIGGIVLEWLENNTIKPREIWKFTLQGGLIVSFGAFQNQCFIFMPRK